MLGGGRDDLLGRISLGDDECHILPIGKPAIAHLAELFGRDVLIALGDLLGGGDDFASEVPDAGIRRNHLEENQVGGFAADGARPGKGPFAILRSIQWYENPANRIVVGHLPLPLLTRRWAARNI